MDLYDAHKDHRDKFEIIAFHDGSVKNFDELDLRLKSVRQNQWHGKDLPFPILLDASGKTIEAFGVHAFPTTILIDPEGKLVGHAREEELESKLPLLPLKERVVRALDRGVSYGFDNPTLGEFTRAMAAVARVPIRFDEPSLQAAGVTPATKVPLKLSGLVSARSWLHLALDPYGLTCEPDDKGLVIKQRNGLQQPSAAQQATAKHLEEVLATRVTFAFRDHTLEDLAQTFESVTGENFVLDPFARKSGTLDPKTKVKGSGKELVLREALEQVLDPLGLTVAIRDEVFIILPKTEKPAKP